jgi:hypothetical protein
MATDNAVSALGKILEFHRYLASQTMIPNHKQNNIACQTIGLL